MRLVDFTLKVLGITEAMRRWHLVVSDVDRRRREKIARYADEIANTLARRGWCSPAFRKASQ